MSEAESFDSFLSEGLEDGVSGLALCDELVSGLAGALYAELERLLGAHGEGAVAGLMPLAVTALETLEGVCAESRERGAQAERAREESERLLAHFERERAQRKRTEEKLLELEDSVEQERKTHKSRLELSASQTRQMELKAKSYLDMTFQLEEEKSSLEKDHKRLLQKYNMILRSLKDLQMQYKLQLADCAKHSGSSTPRENRKKRAFSTEFAEGSSSFTSDRDQGYPDTYSASDEPITPSAANAVVPHPVEEPPSQGQGNEEPLVISVQELETSGTTPDKLSDIEGIILSTPELQPCRQCPVTSTPKSSEDEVIDRNTDSIFQELQSVGSEFIEELDGGVDLLDLGSHVESFVSENAELREKQTMMEAARRCLIARVEELACERSELRTRLRDAVREREEVESKVLELEVALKRAKREAEDKPRDESDDTQLPSAQIRRFTRAEMSRVITERNLYKERLMELQEAVRRSEKMRAFKEHRIAPSRKSSVWDRFNRFLGLSTLPPREDVNSREPAEAVRPLAPIELSPRLRRASVKSFTSDDGSETTIQSGKEQRREHYRQIRSHVWRDYGRSQLHGWSLPHKLWCATGVQLCDQDILHLRQSTADSESEPRVQTPTVPLSTIWICSGTPSETEVMVIDAGRANHVLDHFTIANSHVLCVASVPGFHGGADCSPTPRGSAGEETPSAPASLCGSLASLESVGNEGASVFERGSDQGAKGSERDRGPCTADSGAEEDADSSSNQSQSSRDSAGAEGAAPGVPWLTSALPTVWLGTQSGRLFVHASSSHWRRCLHSIRLKDCIHSIVYSRGHVVVTLANGTLDIFHRNSGGTWDVTRRRCLVLGRPGQNVRCSAPVHDRVWCGYRNRVYVVSPRAAKIEKWFEVTTRAESQVRHLACQGHGVWVSVRLESTLRLFHAYSGQPLQEVDIQPFVSRMFGSGPLGLSFLQVTAMSVFYKRLWIGTGTGIVVSLPLSADPEAGSAPNFANGAPAGQEEQLQGAGLTSSIPYCVMSLAQICFHGHRDAVRFFVAVSASINSSVAEIRGDASNSEADDLASDLVMSGGEGYINFRIGDDNGDSELSRGLKKSDRSHLIVWQMKT